MRAARLSNPSWVDKWMDYSALKKIIGDIAEETGGPEASKRLLTKESNNDTSGIDDANDKANMNEHAANVHNHSPNKNPSKSFDPKRSVTPSRIMERKAERLFFGELKKNLDSVVKFYERQETLLLSRTKKLREEMDAAVKLGEEMEDFASPNEKAISIPLTHLMDSLKVLYVDLMMLENYAVMNYGGFAKILKKHDKNTPFSTQEKYLRKIVNPCAFAFYPRLKEAIATVENGFNVLISLSLKINNAIGKNDSKLLLKRNDLIKTDEFNLNKYDEGTIDVNGHLGTNKRKRTHPRTRLDTPDREKLERLAAISGVVSSSPQANENKDSFEEEEDDSTDDGENQKRKRRRSGEKC
eukprot:g8481.t1